MSRKPFVKPNAYFNSVVGVNAVRAALSPLSNYSRCESPACVRKAITHAIKKDIGLVSQYVELVPTTSTLLLKSTYGRSKDNLKAIESEEDINRASIEASAQLRKARYFFEQAETVGEEIKPILYYYGGTYFLDFICLNLVRREPSGHPGHGLSVTADSKGWDFNKNWSREKCRVHVSSTGDFPFYIDALTVSGCPTLFSKFRLHKNSKAGPWAVIENPAPLFPDKVSLDLLCNFDREQYYQDNPGVKEWATADERVWKLTDLLMDLMVVYIAASLARYYTPAWNLIIEANQDDIFNDIRFAYHNVSVGLALFFGEEYPFQYSYKTRIPPY